MKIPKLDWMAIISGASVAGGAEPIDDGGVEKRFEGNDKTASLPPPLTGTTEVMHVREAH